jgi:hypothetical protein
MTAKQHIPQAFLNEFGNFDCRYDDGTNMAATWVTVEGLPGEWPDGQHSAAVARYAGSVAHMMGSSPSAELKATGIDQINGNFRIQIVDEARQAADYENVLRGYLPAAREELIAAQDSPSPELSQAQRRLASLCVDIQIRSSEALADFYQGVDNTQVIQAQDAARYTA